jgi:acyl dehydratase
MELSAFEAPIDQRYFEDYHKGARFEYGPILVEETEIISFARRFDPQSIHTDPEAASRGPFNGLIASGWHTISLMMRLIVDHYLSAVASLGSPGVDEVRWLRPVRPSGIRRCLSRSIAYYQKLLRSHGRHSHARAIGRVAAVADAVS